MHARILCLLLICFSFFITNASFGQQPKLMLPIGHTEKILGASFSSDGKYIVSSGMKTGVFVWEAASGRLLQFLQEHTKGGIYAWFNNNGKYIVGISADGLNNCLVWEAVTGKLITVQTGTIADVTFDSDKYLTINRPDSLLIVDCSIGKVIYEVDKTIASGCVINNNILYYLQLDERALNIHTVNLKNAALQKIIRLGDLGSNSAHTIINTATDLNFSKTGKYLSIQTTDSLFVLSVLDGLVFYKEKVNANFKVISLFTEAEDLLVRLTPNQEFNGKDDGIVILNLDKKTKTSYRSGDFKFPKLDSNTLYYIQKAIHSYVSTGLVYESRFFSIDLLSGKEKLMYSTMKDVKDFKITNKHVIFSYSNRADGADISKIFRTDIIDKLTGKLLHNFPGEVSLYPEAFNVLWNDKMIVTTNNNDYTLQTRQLANKKAGNHIKGENLKPGVLVFTDLDSVLYTGNKFFDLRKGIMLRNLPGKFVRYDETKQLSSLYDENNNTTTFYNIKTRQPIVRGIGKPITSHNKNDWKYLFTQDNDTVNVTLLQHESRFKAEGQFQESDEANKYLVTAINPFESESAGSIFEKNDKTPDGRDPATWIWDINTGRLKRKIKEQFKGAITDTAGNELQYAITGNSHPDFETLVYSMRTNTVCNVSGDYEYTSPDNSFLYTRINYSKYLEYALPSCRLTDSLRSIPYRISNKKSNSEGMPPVKTDLPYPVEIFSADKKFKLISRQDSSFIVQELNSNYSSVPFRFLMQGGIVLNNKIKQQFSISADKQWLCYSSSAFFNFIVNLNTGIATELPVDIGEIVTSSSFTHNGLYLVTTSSDIYGEYKNAVWSVPKGQRVTNAINDYSYGFSQTKPLFSVSSDTKYCSYYSNGAIKIVNLESEIPLEYSVLEIGGDNTIDYVVQIPTGYYKSTSNAAKLLHYVTKDLKIISFEQLDVKYNRPDKVLEAIGNTDTVLIKSYRKAWEKRINKLGIDTTAFRDGYSVPEADFTNRDDIEYEQKRATLKLHISGNDSTYKIDRLNLWVNETPLYGQRGISLRHKNKNSFDTTIAIHLSQGENKIETSIINVNGTESYRMPLHVNYTPAMPIKESIRFIGIGIDEFADGKNNLQYSVKDIRDLAVKFREEYGENIFIDTLFNQKVTVDNVKVLKQKLLSTTENDKVIIAYSGHGLLSQEFDYFLSTYDVNFNKPEEHGLAYDELENLLDSIPARKKLLLIDACHSGEVDKEEMTRYQQAAATTAITNGAKGNIKLGPGKNSKVGMKNSFELMQNLFVNVGKSTGATIISAAAGTQFALERNDLKNGVFTYCILEAMETNATMKISALKMIVAKRVEELTNGLQKPTSRNEPIAVDWEVW